MLLPTLLHTGSFPDRRKRVPTVITEFAADQTFGIAWLGLMAIVWFGWGQEDPPDPWRWRLGVGSILGLAFAGVFGYSYFAVQEGATALDGRYHWFGVLVGVEFLVAIVGVLVLWRMGRKRWQCWWVGIVVAAHFAPMMFLLNDVGYLLLALVEVVGLLVMIRPLRDSETLTSRLVGPFMGGTLLLFAGISAITYFVTVGSPI